MLVTKYAHCSRIYLSWDAASWHISNASRERVEQHNAGPGVTRLPFVETAALPVGAQFLNVIESVFSGMARAIIHNSDYGSVDHAKVAIDRYFGSGTSAFSLIRGEQVRRYGVKNGSLRRSTPQQLQGSTLSVTSKLLAEEFGMQPVDLVTRARRFPLPTTLARFL